MESAKSPACIIVVHQPMTCVWTRIWVYVCSTPLNYLSQTATAWRVPGNTLPIPVRATFMLLSKLYRAWGIKLVTDMTPGIGSLISDKIFEPSHNSNFSDRNVQLSSSPKLSLDDYFRWH